jgi:hypothetical protein
MVGFSSSPIYRFCNRHCLGYSDLSYKVFNHLVDKMKVRNSRQAGVELYSQENIRIRKNNIAQALKYH